MGIREALVGRGGMAKSRELVRSAADKRELAAEVGAGWVLSLGHGWYALPDLDPAVLRARRLNAVITCVSAARYYGLTCLHPDPSTHLGVPRGRGSRRRPSRPLTGTVLHRESRGGLPTTGGIPLADPVEAMARVLRCAPPEAAIVVVDSALHRRLVTTEEVERELVGPGSVHARLTLARCDAHSRSVIETLARLALRADRLEVRAGVLIEGVGEVDLLVGGRLVVECDGYAYHSGRREYREDRRRDRELIARGFLVLRFTYEDVITDPSVVVREVRRVLAVPAKRAFRR